MKNHRPNLNHAIKALRKQGLRVYQVGPDQYHIGRNPNTASDNLGPYYVRPIISAREVIKNATMSPRSTSIRASVRRDGRRERTFVRDVLRVHGDEADTNFPRQRFSDFWCYD
jgi:hypothetical protein